MPYHTTSHCTCRTTNLPHHQSHATSVSCTRSHLSHSAQCTAITCYACKPCRHPPNQAIRTAWASCVEKLRASSSIRPSSPRVPASHNAILSPRVPPSSAHCCVDSMALAPSWSSFLRFTPAAWISVRRALLRLEQPTSALCPRRHRVLAHGVPALRLPGLPAWRRW